jgi:hypothetical protein
VRSTNVRDTELLDVDRASVSMSSPTGSLDLDAAPAERH